MEQIKNFLLHRSFVGFTRPRDNKPKVFLSVLGQMEELQFGFPELQFRERKEGTEFVEVLNTFTKSGTNRSITVLVKGFYTWDAEDYGLDRTQLNTGLILSVKGIPYINLDMEEYGSTNLRTARPGKNKCCLIAECDQVQEEMNISRSGLVDSEAVELLQKAVTKVFEKIESSQEYLKFRRIPETRKTIAGAESLEIKKQNLEGENQKWVVYQRSDSETPIILAREPENENDVLCMLWKLEALGALPFKKFQTLGHAGYGPDLITHFQEDAQCNPDRYASVEVENKFYNYKIHGHRPAQYPRVMCWEIGKSPKIPVDKTDKKYKFTAAMADFQIHIFTIRSMDGVRVLSTKELRKHGL